MAAIPVRILYAPGHLGNSYEAMSGREMRALLEEAAWWGFNGYADWFDLSDLAASSADTEVLWDCTRARFRAAQEAGLQCGLVVSPNHVYMDQCVPALAAVTGGSRVTGQLVCPSSPEARRLILANHEHWFRGLHDAGVRLTVLHASPYDPGGCLCERCKPWMITFAALVHEIHAIANRYHPGIEAHIVARQWQADEHAQFAAWADAQAPGWIAGMAVGIPFGKTGSADVPLPAGCQRHAFVHIGHAELASPRDLYGHFGPVAAPERIEKTVADLAEQCVSGVMAYSEGVFDDVNKALIAGLASGRYSCADEVLSAYARRYFGADSAVAQRWAEWLHAWGAAFQADPRTMQTTLDELRRVGQTGTWRFRQWELKAQLLELHAAIMAEKEWTRERLARVDAFWSGQETLQREVWGTGTLRGSLARQYTPLPWYNSWARHTRKPN